MNSTDTQQQVGEVQGDALAHALEVLRVVTGRAMQGSETRLAYETVRAALAHQQLAAQVVGHVSRDSSKAHMCVNLPEGSPLYALAATGKQQVGEVQVPVEFDYPEFHAEGMGCGLEDRNITDRYEAMRYGFDEALDQMAAILDSLGPLYAAPPAQGITGWTIRQQLPEPTTEGFAPFYFERPIGGGEVTLVNGAARDWPEWAEEAAKQNHYSSPLAGMEMRRLRLQVETLTRDLLEAKRLAWLLARSAPGGEVTINLHLLQSTDWSLAELQKNRDKSGFTDTWVAKLQGQPQPPAQGIDLGQSHAVLAEVAAERARQEAKWGQQNHVDWTRTTATSDLAGVWPGGVGRHFKWITDYKAAGKEGHSLGYFDILMEEVAEAHDEARGGNIGALREEVIQVAAVAVAWVECIDRRQVLIDQRDAAPRVGQ